MAPIQVPPLGAVATAAPSSPLQPPQLRTLETLDFTNSFVTSLPADSETRNYMRIKVEAAFSYCEPTPPEGLLSAPQLVAASADMAARIGLAPEELLRPAFVAAMAGVEPLPGARPFASCYGGHQFGEWAGQLGDGRAIVLGEVRGADGCALELQLKGSGKTPYARGADGRAVLRSSVREFLASEAMAALGIPTTRALALVTTGDALLRDQFYTGEGRLEPGAVVCRVAPSFLRFGSLELPAVRGDVDLLRQLASYALEHHFPQQAALEGPARYAALYSEIVRRTAHLAAAWQLVGFAHGVGNTDNMSLLGLTLDYGPFAFIDVFDPDFSPNTSDPEGRYAFGAQPSAVAWNCAKLGAALTPLIEDDAATQEIADGFGEQFGAAFHEGLRAKLGLLKWRGAEDLALAMGLFKLMAEGGSDYTATFRALGRVPSGEGRGADAWTAVQAAAGSGLPVAAERRSEWDAWLRNWQRRLRADGRPDAERRADMDAVNPKYVLRNHLAHTAILAAEAGDYAGVQELHELLKQPYEEQPERESFASLPPAWAAKRGVAKLSCSS